MKKRFAPAQTMMGLVAFALSGFTKLPAQNVVDRGAATEVLPAETLPPDFAERLIVPINSGRVVLRDDASRRIVGKLDAHVRELIEGWPWRPLHHVLGISGFETYFDHPDELFHALTLAYDCLPPQSQARVARFLADRLADSPPFEVDGFDRAQGQARESYDVPEALRAKGRGAAHSVFGIAAFARYVAQAGENGDKIELASHWEKIRNRIAPLLGLPNVEPSRVSARGDETEVLNGNLAGLIGAAQLAQKLDDHDAVRAILPRIQQLAQLRADLERTNPRYVEKSVSASKQLHHFKLARYCALTPENTRCLEGATRELAANRLRAFREMRPGWHLALGERLIGGENYTNPLHFDRALFAGAALIEALPANELFRFIDVPACKADFYFIEKCALALRRAAH